MNTPRTDAEILKVHAMCEDTCIESWVENMDGDTVDFVDAEFARGLERELQTALDALQGMADQYITNGKLPDGRWKYDHMHNSAGEDALDVLEFHGRVGVDQSDF